LSLAAEIQAANPDWRVVHGVVDATVGAIPHAWLECDGIIFDPTLNERLPADEYCRRYDARANSA